MDDYIKMFCAWLSSIALNNVDNRQYEEMVVDIIDRIDNGGLKQYMKDIIDHHLRQVVY